MRTSYLILIACLCLVDSSPAAPADSARDIYQQILDKGMGVAVRDYRASRRSREVPGETGLRQLGAKFLAEDRAREAVTIFQFQVATFPDCPIAHNLLGEAYEKNQQLRWARAHYLAALEKNRSSQVERSEHYQEDLDRVVAQLQARSKEPKKGRKGRAAHVLEVLDLRPGYVAADIGCGNGWLSEAVAKSVGPQGKVFAVDIRESSISKVLERELPNVEPVLSVEDSVTLPVDSLDVAFLHDVAAHVEKKARSRFYASIGRALKPAGRLIIFDPHGDAKEHLQELERYGFLPEQREELSGLSWDELDVQLKAGIRFRYQAVQRF